ncbi:MAG: MetQ/NlpA family ABC transporter substrate-binding protein [Bacillota bacterium]|jgi:D-methionine transport system substrate-binding protein
MKKKLLSLILTAALCVTALVGLTACGSGSDGDEGAAAEVTIAVPNDTTNEARALLLLQELGYITLDENAGITATINDITDNPYNITFKEVEAAQLPNVLQDVDYAVINSNYAIEADLNPTEDALALEGSSSAYSNILAVKEGNETSDAVKALVAALESQQVADYITDTYDGAVVSVVENPGDGYDAAIDYDALAGTTITVAASPTPHAEILAIAKDILAAKDITLDVKEFTDYVQPNNVVDSGEIDANYFQHTPYLDDFNAENGTHIVSVAAIHVEPLGIYGGKQSSLDAIQ